jgi:predicted flavoprotein YhiN
LPVRDSRGYGFAEVTAGGVPLEEIDPASMASRRTSGLFLVGEILDVDGRIGGFNFQWAWSTGFVAGTALAAASARGMDRSAIIPAGTGEEPET